MSYFGGVEVCPVVLGRWLVGGGGGGEKDG